jgi:hypothetical protein
MLKATKRKGEIMHQRHDDGNTSSSGNTPPTDDDNIIHIAPEDRECFTNLILNPPEPTKILDAVRRTEAKGFFKFKIL